jgi:UDP-galactopyranose mutase
MNNYDYLIVGSGLVGSVFEREMTYRGFKTFNYRYKEV